jgi:hypothetical protein
MGSINYLAASGPNILAGIFYSSFNPTAEIGYLSTDSGVHWTTLTMGDANIDTNIIIVSSAISGSNFFVGTSKGIYLSTDAGSNWTSVNTGLTDSDYVTSFFPLWSASPPIHQSERSAPSKSGLARTPTTEGEHK